MPFEPPLATDEERIIMATTAEAAQTHIEELKRKNNGRLSHALCKRLLNSAQDRSDFLESLISYLQNKMDEVENRQPELNFTIFNDIEGDFPRFLRTGYIFDIPSGKYIHYHYREIMRQWVGITDRHTSIYNSLRHDICQRIISRAQDELNIISKIKNDVLTPHILQVSGQDFWYIATEILLQMHSQRLQDFQQQIQQQSSVNLGLEQRRQLWQREKEEKKHIRSYPRIFTQPQPLHYVTISGQQLFQHISKYVNEILGRYRECNDKQEFLASTSDEVLKLFNVISIIYNYSGNFPNLDYEETINSLLDIPAIRERFKKQIRSYTKTFQGDSDFISWMKTNVCPRALNMMGISFGCDSSSGNEFAVHNHPPFIAQLVEEIEQEERQAAASPSPKI